MAPAARADAGATTVPSDTTRPTTTMRKDATRRLARLSTIRSLEQEADDPRPYRHPTAHQRRSRQLGGAITRLPADCSRPQRLDLMPNELAQVLANVGADGWGVR